MILKQPEVAVQQDVNMIPLINVVFLLLAFFMIAGQIDRLNKASVNPLISTSETEQDESGAQLVITASAVTIFNGNRLQRDQLTESLRLALEQGHLNADSSLLINADSSLPAKELQDVLAKVRQAGVHRVALATIRDPSAPSI